MGNAYIFTLQPTFTQGLVLGQVSILVLLFFILKYLFFVSGQVDLSYQPRLVHSGDLGEEEETQSLLSPDSGLGKSAADYESADWLNVVLQQVLNAYRTKLRDNLLGVDGDEVARRRVEAFANKMRPPTFVDPIKVHSVDLGTRAPTLSNARRKLNLSLQTESVELDIAYSDTLSISISTAVLFNYPFASFARLPVSLTITLSLLSTSVLVEPPSPRVEHPTITFTVPSSPSDFILNLKTTSLMGSKAKLADVPKLHELIVHQIRKAILDKGTWKVVLPGLASVKEVKEDIAKEQEVKAGLDRLHGL
ncbi:maintenance of mitochondrial morphology protein 1 [Cristinia sonorae]|uniref:Maintenance of mitochondrial morphology protein 1 n=1 Tax=Cristinia sonorae TaxID=1940300 RepID=A0A8K0UNH6_9AGAR|nr:maintenance of mitochondrial morphology protein 1 [Cristinia sonorae]